MNRKNHLPFILLFLLSSVLTISSCKKDDDKPTTEADKYTGEWNVSHLVVEKSATSTYKCTITKQNDSTLKISANPSPKPTYFFDITLSINWKDKSLYMPGTLLYGTLNSEKDFELSYTWTEGSSTYHIKQHYTR